MENLAEYQQVSTWEGLGILREVKFKASRAGGKGGQNVNKVSTKVELHWSPSGSKMLPAEVRERLMFKLSSKMNTEGEIRIVCEEERSQLKNKQKAIAKLYALLSSCFKERKKRKATKPSKVSVKKRLEEKGRKKQLKADRRKPDF